MPSSIESFPRPLEADLSFSLPKMSSSFTISPVVDADFDRMLTYTEKAGGTLAAPLVFATWPAPARDTVATDRRNKWSIEQQRWQFHNDATAHFVKVEDTMTQEIISLARWHRYPKGYPQEDAYMEVDVFARPDRGLSPNFPDGLNGPLHVSCPAPQDLYR